MFGVSCGTIDPPPNGCHPNGLVAAGEKANTRILAHRPGRTVESMRAVIIPEFGGPEVLSLQEIPAPQIGSEDVLIDVAAAGINRADLLQRQGLYPPPAGAPQWPGLECARTVREVGVNVRTLKSGDRVMALLAGGGYAEQVSVPAGQVMPIPQNLSFTDAAAIPEALATAWANLVIAGGLKSGNTVFISGGSGGVGSLAIQLARRLGARVIASAGSDERAARCADLGAELALNYRREDVVQRVRDFTDGIGVDVLLDVLGAGALDSNLRMLTTGGRLVIIGLQQGAKGELNIARLMNLRARIIGTTLRSRPTAEKAAIVAEASACALPWYQSGKMVPVVHGVYDLDDAAQAHRDLDSGEVFGKLILRV